MTYVNVNTRYKIHTVLFQPSWWNLPMFLMLSSNDPTSVMTQLRFVGWGLEWKGTRSLASSPDFSSTSDSV